MTDIITRIDDRIGYITLNRPSVRNAISREMWDELPRALASLLEQGARVVVIRGEGDHFSAGADLAEMAQLTSTEAAREHWDSIRNALNAVAAFELPTIASIAGSCMGGGCLLACACDLRYCHFGAKFSVPIAQLGIMLDADNIFRLMNIVGRGAASEMLFTARVVPATGAVEIGLVNGATDNRSLDKLVLGVANDIKGNSPTAMAQIKSTIAQIGQRGRVEEDQEAIVASYLSEEFRERVGKALTRKS